MSNNQELLFGYLEPLFSRHELLNSKLMAYHKTSKKAFNGKRLTNHRNLEVICNKLRQLLVQSKLSIFGIKGRRNHE